LGLGEFIFDWPPLRLGRRWLLGKDFDLPGGGASWSPVDRDELTLLDGTERIEVDPKD
jgi:hypothetical protein